MQEQDEEARGERKRARGGGGGGGEREMRDSERIAIKVINLPRSRGKSDSRAGFAL